MKLNLGCGSQRLPGYCNVDKFGQPDIVWDLETFPWPWDDNAAEEVLLSHTLEHLGQTPDGFIAIIKELYRVCRDGALVKVVVPHPRHDYYISDPTHVRPILPLTLEMFSKRLNREWQSQGASNTPLGLYHDVDFELVSTTSMLDEPYRTLYLEKKLSVEQLQDMERTLYNIVVQVEMVLKAVKPA